MELTDDEDEWELIEDVEKGDDGEAIERKWVAVLLDGVVVPSGTEFIIWGKFINGGVNYLADAPGEEYLDDDRGVEEFDTSC